MKNNKIIIFILIAISLVGFNLFSLSTKADSGWDSSYDSGGWDSSDSWSSSDSGWYSSGSYDGDDSLSGGAFFVVLIVIIIVVIIASKSKGSSYSSNSTSLNTYFDISDEELAKYGIDKNSFKQMAYDKYVEIQKSWSDFDYDKLRTLLTDELYNSYMMQLDALKLKNQKNIMSDFKFIDCKITEVKEENGLLNINTYLRVEMYDYVVDSENKVMRGDKNHKIDIEYIITFVKIKNNIVNETICPNCGAKIETVTSGKCEYCGTVVVVDAKDYVMSKKTCVGQRRK